MTSNNLLLLADELLSMVLVHLSATDLVTVTNLVSKRLRNENYEVFLAVWRLLLTKKWNINLYQYESNICTDLSKMSYIYSKSRPIIADIKTVTDVVITDKNSKKVTFRGRVGVANRSVQSCQAFPRLLREKPEGIVDKFKVIAKQFFDFMYGKDVELDPKGIVEYSTPYAIATPEGSIYFDTDARPVYYYEVTISSAQEVVNNVDTNQFPEDFECVAVGLATRYFSKDRLLPGWDMESYGYHGDDGAIYHGRGRQLGAFGSTFGLDDTVGCGINYVDRSIFFTLNGKLLGEAFKNVSTELALFPTVGIDSRCSLQFNFGLTPFVFDLKNYMDDIRMSPHIPI